MRLREVIGNDDYLFESVHVWEMKLEFNLQALFKQGLNLMKRSISLTWIIINPNIDE